MIDLRKGKPGIETFDGNNFLVNNWKIILGIIGAVLVIIVVMRFIVWILIGLGVLALIWIRRKT